MGSSAREAADLVRVVLVTAPDAEKGKELARLVVGERLAACGNVIPGLTSVYRWSGSVQEDPEVLILFKTTQGALEALKARVVELHPYQVPEFLALPITDGHLPYLQWVLGEVDEPERS